ncbi:hypothetical protein CRENBAI_014527 [Crenichthys baileyi]|uniref:Secreted protein n=1 Tax=Crenichthys baileyi TaxID=28760 RepID=A0AAV9R337_9TELE
MVNKRKKWCSAALPLCLRAVRLCVSAACSSVCVERRGRGNLRLVQASPTVSPPWDYLFSLHHCRGKLIGLVLDELF